MEDCNIARRKCLRSDLLRTPRASPRTFIKCISHYPMKLYFYARSDVSSVPEHEYAKGERFKIKEKEAVWLENDETKWCEIVKRKLHFDLQVFDSADFILYSERNDFILVKRDVFRRIATKILRWRPTNLTKLHAHLSYGVLQKCSSVTVK